MTWTPKSRRVSRAQRRRASEWEASWKTFSVSLQSIDHLIPISLSLARPLQLCPASQSKTLSPRASSRCPITAQLWGTPRLPEGSAGRQDGHRCLPTPAPACPCTAVWRRCSLCRIHCKYWLIDWIFVNPPTGLRWSHTQPTGGVVSLISWFLCVRLSPG